MPVTPASSGTVAAAASSACRPSSATSFGGSSLVLPRLRLVGVGPAAGASAFLASAFLARPACVGGGGSAFKALPALVGGGSAAGGAAAAAAAHPAGPRKRATARAAPAALLKVPR